MATHTTLASLFTDIADSIRAKTGKTDNIVADDFPEEIAGITTGGEDLEYVGVSDGIEQYGLVDTTNGVYVSADGCETKLLRVEGENGEWTATTMPSSASWYSVTYGDGKFVAVAYASNKAAYSIDGINWTATTMPSSAAWYSVAYGDGKFVAVINGSTAAYSIDGINWTATTMPDTVYWYSVTYGDDKFVAVASGSSTAAYKIDNMRLVLWR